MSEILVKLRTKNAGQASKFWGVLKDFYDYYLSDWLLIMITYSPTLDTLGPLFKCLMTPVLHCNTMIQILGHWSEDV